VDANIYVELARSLGQAFQLGVILGDNGNDEPLRIEPDLLILLGRQRLESP